MKTPAKLALLASLYLSQGLPFGFFTQALPVLMRKQGLSLPAISSASLLAIPWALKFLWAPVVDRHGSARIGRRRCWILPLQMLAAALMLGMALLPSPSLLGILFAGVFLANLLAATQDIATDALAVELLRPHERGLGNGVQVAGYRVGMILGGGLLLVVFDRLGWANSFVAIAAMLAAATVPIALFRESAHLAPPEPETQAGDRRSLHPLAAFVARPGMGAWLAAIAVYKAGDALASAMVRPFLVDRGLDLADIGWLLGTAGFLAGLLGAMVGGWGSTRFGRRRALLGFGAIQAVAVAMYVLPALSVGGSRLLYAVVTAEHFTGGTATAALFTMMMDACRERSAATDYTVQASVVVIATGAFAAASGFVAQHVGYTAHFAMGAALCALGLAYVSSIVRATSPAGSGPASAPKAQSDAA